MPVQTDATTWATSETHIATHLTSVKYSPATYDSKTLLLLLTYLFTVSLYYYPAPDTSGMGYCF